MLAVPETHALAKAGQVRLAKFAGEDFVIFKRSEAPKLADAMMQLCAKAGFTPQVVSELPMIQTMLMAVAASIGVAIVPGCVRSFCQPGVTILPVRLFRPILTSCLHGPKASPRRRFPPGWNWCEKAAGHSPTNGKGSLTAIFLVKTTNRTGRTG